MTTIQQWFKIGMKRDIPALIEWYGDALDLGGQGWDGVQGLSLPNWNAMSDAIPAWDGSISTLWASHFFEHLYPHTVRKVLRECERVLRPGGVLNVVVPYYTSQMAHHDQDHKTFWTEATWDGLLNPKYPQEDNPLLYAPFKFRVHACFIIGIVERNMALFTQLVRLP